MEVKDLKPIEKATIDTEKYEGTKAKIESMEVKEVDSRYSMDGKELPNGQTTKVQRLVIKTEPLDKLKIKDKEISIYASEMFSLVQDEEGNWGFSTNPNSKLSKFLAKHKVSDPSELVGKQVIVLVRKGFLGFHTE